MALLAPCSLRGFPRVFYRVHLTNAKWGIGNAEWKDSEFPFFVCPQFTPCFSRGSILALPAPKFSFGVHQTVENCKMGNWGIE